MVSEKIQAAQENQVQKNDSDPTVIAKMEKFEEHL